MRISTLFISMVLFTISCIEPPRDAEILWDQYGIPHIYAQTADDLFYAYGWAQAHAHGDLLLRLYGRARGKGAEFWGEKYLDSDKWMWTNGVPARATQWAAEQVDPGRSMLESYLAGVNNYAAKHPENISADFKVVYPLLWKT